MRSLKFFMVVGFLLLVSCDKRTPQEKEVYGVVNSRFMTGADVQRHFSISQEQFNNLSIQQKQEYFAKLSEEYILEHESKKIKLSSESILGFFDKINPSHVSKNEIQEYLLRFPEMKKMNQESLLKQIRADRLERAKLRYRAELRKRSTVKDFIKQTESGL